jgi:hypothetical protein
VSVLPEKKVVSTITLLVLMLCSAIFGGLISYLFVMGSFYLEAPGLVITDLNFPVDHPDYFNVTVMNPSHSPYGTDIAEIYYTVEGENNETSVTDTLPEALPIPLEIGTSKTIQCMADWGSFAGKMIFVHVSATNASGAVYYFATQLVKLDVKAYFNSTESIKYFNVSVTNNEGSAINLTLSSIYLSSTYLSSVLIQNMTVNGINVTLPMTIDINETINFQCFYDWTGVVNPTVLVETSEEYIARATQIVPSIAQIQVTHVSFDETNPNEINITLLSLPESDTSVDITDIALTCNNITDHLNGNLTNPPLPYPLEYGSNVTFDCAWNWTDKSYRDTDITVTAYTKQGFVSQLGIPYKTPSEVVAKITATKFDLDDTDHFLVNMTNMPCSLYEVNVTNIMLNQTSTVMNPSIIPIGNPSSFTCNFTWTDFVGKTIPITVNMNYNENETSSISYNVTIPYIKVRAIAFSNFSLGNPYTNITIYDSAFSSTNANLTQMSIITENQTYLVDGTIANPKISPQGYELANGTEITVVCPWDWTPYLGRDVTVVVQTADGSQVSIAVPVVYTP